MFPLTTTAPGAVPALDIVADLAHKPGYTMDSWFVIGHFEDQGHTLDYLVHLFAISLRGVLVGVDTALSVTDETTGWYGARNTFHPFFHTTVTSDRLLVRTPAASITGTLDDLRVRGRVKDADIDVALRAVGHPLYNRGTGRFGLLGMDVFQYSVPTLETSGRLVVEGREFTASGLSWFDRQWQNQPLGPPAGRWTWMDLNLDNGWHVSLWNAVGPDRTTDAFVTLIDATGTHTVTDLVPLAHDAGDYWFTPEGSRFPTRWQVRVPGLDAELTVRALPREQALSNRLGERFEGASTVRGVVEGRPVTGHCYVEMVGDWKA